MPSRRTVLAGLIAGLTGWVAAAKHRGRAAPPNPGTRDSTAVSAGVVPDVRCRQTTTYAYYEGWPAGIVEVTTYDAFGRWTRA
jgi:hypothetical protein